MSFPLVHVEFQVKDLDKAQAWYTKVFGWNLEKYPELNYVSTPSDHEGVGIGLNAGEMSAGAIPYVPSTDIPGLLQKVEGAGGKVISPESEIPGMGTFAIFADPDGNTIGVINFPTPN